MKIKEFITDFKEIELENIDSLDLDEKDEKEFISFVNEFCNVEVEDRDIILEDLKRNQGYLYKFMVSWNESEMIQKLDLNMMWWEYSLEDYFRDSFTNEKNSYGYKLFSIKDINKMLYFNLKD